MKRQIVLSITGLCLLLSMRVSAQSYGRSSSLLFGNNYYRPLYFLDSNAKRIDLGLLQTNLAWNRNAATMTHASLNYNFSVPKVGIMFSPGLVASASYGYCTNNRFVASPIFDLGYFREKASYKISILPPIVNLNSSSIEESQSTTRKLIGVDFQASFANGYILAMGYSQNFDFRVTSTTLIEDADCLDTGTSKVNAFLTLPYFSENIYIAAYFPISSSYKIGVNTNDRVLALCFLANTNRLQIEAMASALSVFPVRFSSLLLLTSSCSYKISNTLSLRLSLHFEDLLFSPNTNVPNFQSYYGFIGISTTL